jgi:lactate racemase
MFRLLHEQIGHRVARLDYLIALGTHRPMTDDAIDRLVGVTAAKAMYKTEPVVAGGGEIVIYAPHITEVSYTHGRRIDEVGYHVRDYCVKQWDRFEHVPGGILAHSTHVKGTGTFEGGVETPRIRVTLATGIPEERCQRVDLGHAGHRAIDRRGWAGRDQMTNESNPEQ